MIQVSHFLRQSGFRQVLSSSQSCNCHIRVKMRIQTGSNFNLFSAVTRQQHHPSLLPSVASLAVLWTKGRLWWGWVMCLWSPQVYLIKLEWMSLGAGVYLNFSLFLLLGLRRVRFPRQESTFHNSILKFTMNAWALHLQSWWCLLTFDNKGSCPF